MEIKKLIRSVVRKLFRSFGRSFVTLFYFCSARFNSRSGCLQNKRRTPLIVSLTTIPERLEKVYLCIESLLRQSCKPDYLLLWISDAVKPNDIPASLARLAARGLQIRFCKDIRSYKKIIYSLREYPHAIIATADDDKFYPKDWLKQLYEAHQHDPACIICHRAHLMTRNTAGNLDSYNNWDFASPGVTGPSALLFPTGVCGILYPPGSLHSEVLNEKVFMDICPTADDIWLKAMSLLNGVACKKVTADSAYYFTVKGTQGKKLWTVNKHANDRQIRAVFTRYALYESIKG